ncbi:ABC transporter substrate-binding protein [Crenalkalicoccus roseus]|uniref:ABC transporter substrate-binding protein n=1 Tax=Crenalkalicoccus roseus TaxID=1485588 RepID=UPI00108102BA|nr:ABC transporter substrate-binding protein [Crenalkalicoccus roseus]
MPSRRHLLLGGAAATLAPRLAAPALAQGAAARTLRFIPHSNLGTIDPIGTTGYVVRNHGYLVYDTLFATDAEFRIRPQMVEAWEGAGTDTTWTFRLREGLRFHDGEPVRAQDCVPSLRRWGARDAFGQTLMEAVGDIEVVDDRTFRIRLTRPFPLLLEAIGKLSSQVPFIMPERFARLDPNQAVPEAIGSGPYRFRREEWVPGSLAVYERFDGYVPRQEPPSWAAGGKVARMERVEWRILPDPSTAAAALQTGEVDWYEQPAFDLLPLLQRSREIRIEQIDPVGSILMLRFNHLHPPFDNPGVRRAVQMAVNQADYLQAVVGNPRHFRECKSFFTCGTPLASDAGAEAMGADLERARRMLREAGYGNEPVVIISPTDIPANHQQGVVTQDLLQRLGMRVEFVATDWGTVLARRASRNPPGQGGWSIFHTWWVGPDLANPALHAPLRAHGANAWPGWPTDERLEALRTEFLNAPSPEAQKEVARRIQLRAFEVVPYVTIGQMWQPTAFRRNVQDIIGGPIPFFWNVRKA